MATTLIGTLRPHAKGVHVQANAYNIMDVVTSADGSRAYMAIKDVPAGTSLTNTSYWCIYTDLSAVKTEMENAAARADASAASANEAINNLTDYTGEYALRVRGEIGESAGNPVTIAPDEGSLIRPVTVFSPKQAGSGDPSPSNERPISGYDVLGLNHAGKNLTAQLGQTVYGGRMDWTKGELLVEYEKIVLDGVNMPVITVWENALYVSSNMTGRGYKMPKVQAKGVCSHFPVTPGGVSSASVHFSHDSYGSVYIGAIPGVNGADAYNAYLQTNPITCAYEIQEPFTIQLTPHQILALQGVNTLYGDGDTIEVEWVKPLETSIEERTQPLIERISALEAVILNS